MSFGRRLALFSTVGIAAVLIVGSLATYLVVRDQLRGQIDDSLRRQARRVELIDRKDPALDRPADFTKEIPSSGRGLGRRSFVVPAQEFGASPVYVALLDPEGRELGRSPGGVKLPSSPSALAAAAAGVSTFEDSDVRGTHTRLLTTPVSADRILIVARSLADVDRTLSRLTWSLALVCLCGTLLAAAVGAAVARSALKPIRRLTQAAERVSQTRDLSGRIEITTTDELGYLGTTFNGMLDSLEGSLRTQRQLVSDASHELRTPLTSVRTNIDLLRQGVALSEHDRTRLLEDLGDELEELTTLVGNLVALARGSQRDLHLERVRLDEIVENVVRRAEARFSDLTFELEAEDSHVWADQDELERAVWNLLENAAKWSGGDGTVHIRVESGSVAITDHGPGVSIDDRPYLFDRFYRAETARGLPGSGLGLAIVRQVAESHGGRVEVEDAPGGGARFRLTLLTDDAPVAKLPTGA